MQTCRDWRKCKSSKFALILYHTYSGIINELWSASAPKRTRDFTHHAAALIASLDEFQKAQVFFIISVQLAALIAVDHKSLSKRRHTLN